MYPLACSLTAVKYQKDHRLKGDLEVGERVFLVREMERAVKVRKYFEIFALEVQILQPRGL